MLEVLNFNLASTASRYVEQKSALAFNYQASYTYISDQKDLKHCGYFKPALFEDNSFK